MAEITCPHCHKHFEMDESGYAATVKQVHDQEFSKEVAERMCLLERQKEKELELIKAKEASERQKLESSAREEVQQLKARLEAMREAAKKDEALAVARAQDALKERLEQATREADKLKAALEQGKTAQELAVTKAVSEAEKERDRLRHDLERVRLERESAERALKERFQIQVRDREEQIERLRDMKARLSTKMVGETLERHCETEFNMIRAAAFPQAYFDKDNDARTGSKGDYIFRDYVADESGKSVEIISIMFEMKNESDTTATKKHNEDFLKELDKDRREKNCEYAILVSLLEAENDLYNRGIVDVSHLYPKTYIVRPQFFIPIISLLTNAARRAASYKIELEYVRAQNVDVANFEDKLEEFKGRFGKNYESASKHFQKAVEEIDKSIDHLEKTKKALLTSENQLRLANDKAQDISIKRLTHGNPTMAEKFKALKSSD